MHTTELALVAACLACACNAYNLDEEMSEVNTPSSKATLASLLLANSRVVGFNTAGMRIPHRETAAVRQRRGAAAQMVEMPRITLPDAITEKLSELDLKNPNELSSTDYNTYTGAAILGTLLFYVLPGAAITGNDFGELLVTFLLSALTGGGLGAYLSLREDQVGDYANQAGGLLSALGDLPRITLPDAITDVLKEQGLKNPNELSTSDYNSYASAAILGTLLAVLPISGIVDADLGAILTDFVISALIGGGAGAYLSLRKDDLGDYANKGGQLVIDAFDKVVD